MNDVTEFTTVVFDVDGTLIDSNDAHADAYVEALRLHGLPADFVQVRRLIGMGGDKVIPALAGVMEVSPLGQSIAQRKKEVFARLLPALRPTRSARLLVEFLGDNGLDVVIATSAGNDELRALLGRADVADLIPERTSKDDAEASKPEPDIVRAALAKAARFPWRQSWSETPLTTSKPRRAWVSERSPFVVAGSGRTKRLVERPESSTTPPRCSSTGASDHCARDDSCR